VAVVASRLESQPFIVLAVRTDWPDDWSANRPSGIGGNARFDEELAVADHDRLTTLPEVESGLLAVLTRLQRDPDRWALIVNGVGR
jgi:hypothetical protein